MEKVNKPLEKEIQLSICRYLDLKGYFFWRENTIPVVAKGGGFRSMPKYSKTGVPDIILVKDGRFIGLEVKREKTKQSESQIFFQHDLEKAGGEYYIVRSVDDIRNLGL